MSLAPKRFLDLGHGSGDPAGFPGYRPLNPWGRPMPKTERKPLPALHQVFVERGGIPGAGGEVIAIGPQAGEEFCRQFCTAIEGEIAAGREQHWRNPHVVKLLRG